MPGQRLDTARFFAFLPNAFGFVMADHAFVVVVTPVSAKRSVERGLLLIDVRRRQDSDYVNKLSEFYRRTNNLEDIPACEGLQRGLASRPLGKRGGPAVQHEPCTMAFDEAYQRKMGRSMM